MMGRAEIETGAPFRSVKEAVSLFGDRILDGENYDGSLGEKHAGESGIEKPKRPRLETLEAELDEAKESLKKAIKENEVLSRLTKSLTEELETTKKELNTLKSRAMLQQHENPPVEHFKFIERPRFSPPEEEEEEDEDCLENKRYVKFASPPSLTKVIAGRGGTAEKQRLDVTKPKKMKPLVPLVGWIFARNKPNR